MSKFAHSEILCFLYRFSYNPRNFGDILINVAGCKEEDKNTLILLIKRKYNLIDK